jgi:adenine phosphoribosyltransferase
VGTRVVPAQGGEGLSPQNRAKQQRAFFYILGFTDDSMQSAAELIRSKVRDIPDFPKPGILFRDITSVWKHAGAFQACMDAFAEHYAPRGFPGAPGATHPDLIVGIESRGFVVGSAFAARAGLGFVPIRKRGKLPAEVHSHEYDLEYGSDCVEIHKDAVEPGQSVVIMDDLLATGGTLLASIELLKRVGARVIGCAVVIDLPDLGGSRRIEDAGYPVFSIVAYPGH